MPSRQENMQAHLEWCEKQLEQDRKSLEMCESGQLKLHENHEDITPEVISRLRGSIAELEKHIERVKSDLAAFKLCTQSGFDQSLRARQSLEKRKPGVCLMVRRQRTATQ